MKRCLSIVLNAFTNDSRVLRESETLAKNGFRVVVFALHEGDLPLEEEQSFLSLRRFKLTMQGWSKGKFGQAIMYAEYIGRMVAARVRARPAVVHANDLSVMHTNDLYTRPIRYLVALKRTIAYAECVGRMVAAGVRVRPTVVHANDLDALPIGYLVARLTGAKLIYDAHELWRDPEIRGWIPTGTFDLDVRLEGWLARRADGVMTVSESIAVDMAEKMKIAKPQVVRNLPPSKRSAVGLELNEKYPLHRTLGLSSEVPIVLYQGNIHKDRGVEILLDAFQWVERPAVLVFLGNGIHAGSLKQRAKELGICDRVFFHPAVPPDVLLYYVRDAAVGVVPAGGSSLCYQYSLPNKLFECLQAGLPVVVSNLPEMAAVVKGYGVGEVFAHRNPRSLAETLSAVLEPGRLKRYTEAVNLAARELNWEREESKFLQVYKDTMLSM